MKLTEKQIDAAVKWWGNALKVPKFQTLRPDDNSEGSKPAAMAQVMAMISHSEPEEDAVDKFKIALRSMLEDGEKHLSVDYGPCLELGRCLDAAGITSGMSLPWKTTMRFDDNGVQVACGYGEPFVELVE